MKRVTFSLALLFSFLMAFSQTGHVLQGVGSVNMSMGGAATGQPIDISGSLQWNPAAISAFDGTNLKFDIGLFFSSPELSSTVPVFGTDGMPTGNFISGTTKDDRGVSPLPSLAVVWGDAESKHRFGASAFGISGFGVTFPESMTNPINMPQAMGGFGRIESEYSLFQLGFTWSYQFTDRFSLGLQPNFNIATLELMPNPTANPNASGYPTTDKSTTTGFGGQIGLYYEAPSGFSGGLSYKTKQSFSEFDLDNTYLDGSRSTNQLALDYPAIFSVGLGYSLTDWDFALDYRYIDYENTDGFDTTGWTSTASVAGFGWDSISVISAGIQYKGVDKVPLRLGYTYSSNPIGSDVAFFNVPATAIIKNAFQFGLSYQFGPNFQLDGVYHFGTSSGSTSGPLLSPMLVSNFPPYGAVPGSEVSYDMTTSMVMVGVSYKFGSKQDEE